MTPNAPFAPTAPGSPSSPIEEDLTRIEALAARARCEVAAGGLCDLTHLDAKVREVCGHARGLDPRTGRKVRARLLGVYDELGSLAEAIRHNLADLQSRLGDNAKRRQATSAYGKSPRQAK